MFYIHLYIHTLYYIYYIHYIHSLYSLLHAPSMTIHVSLDPFSRVVTSATNMSYYMSTNNQVQLKKIFFGTISLIKEREKRKYSKTLLFFLSCLLHKLKVLVDHSISGSLILLHVGNLTWDCYTSVTEGQTEESCWMGISEGICG